MNESQQPFRGWEYARQGDYHRNIDPSWSFAPTYFQKMSYVGSVVERLPADARILDVGCGEGVLVEKYARLGRKIEGIDLNYSSDFVRQGDILKMPYAEAAFDAVLFLDVFEHLHFADQRKALQEIRRVLKPGGTLVVSIPNMAHLNSRIRFLFKGLMDRCDIEENHPGERPMAENRQILEEQGFRIDRIKGITLTLPFIYRRLICKHAAGLRWLHDALGWVALPGWSLLNVFVCERK